MADREMPVAIDLQFLHEASALLLGYFVHTWYTHYLRVIADSLRRLVDIGAIENLGTATEQGKNVVFDSDSLDTEKLSYIIGIYSYILFCHKIANHRLMNQYDGKQVMYLRGYDFEGTMAAGGAAVGFSTIDTQAFSEDLSGLLGPDSRIFRVLSPKDVFWETTDAQRYFGGDYGGMIQYIRRRPGSVYLNALTWREGITDLLDRMDYYIVYVSSITESALWELRQLDTNERRGRVTVVFDEQAIGNKVTQVSFQDAFRGRASKLLTWAGSRPSPGITAAGLRAELSRKFLVTTPEEFGAQIGRHRERIAASSSRLVPGKRETWIDFRFHPALDAKGLDKIKGFAANLQGLIDAAVRDGITCLPLFLDQVQLRIYVTLLLGEHDQTGRALAAYGGVMRGMLDYYKPRNQRVGWLPARNKKSTQAVLRHHLDLAEYTGKQLLGSGRSHEFGDFSAAAAMSWDAGFEATTAAVATFFKS